MTERSTDESRLFISRISISTDRPKKTAFVGVPRTRHRQWTAFRTNPRSLPYCFLNLAELDMSCNRLLPTILSLSLRVQLREADQEETETRVNAFDVTP